MSSPSVTSNKRDKWVQDLEQELEALRSMNSTLRAYMEYLEILKRNLAAMHENGKQLSKVNSQWIDALHK